MQTLCFQWAPIQKVLTDVAKSLPSFGQYRNDDLVHLPIERSFAVSGIGRIAVGILKGNKTSLWKPKVSLDLVAENQILSVEMIQTGMFYKRMEQSKVGDRVNCLLKSKVNKFGKFVNRGGVLVPEGLGDQYHKDEFSFTPELGAPIAPLCRFSCQLFFFFNTVKWRFEKCTHSIFSKD